MSHQRDFVKEATRKGQRKIHVNKSRQIGYTEIVLRILQFLCFTKYQGGKIMIIAGTREKTSKKIMHRFKQLFNNIRTTVLDDRNDLKMKLTNGTEIEALPSNSDAIRGDTKINCIFIDEAAHFNRIDDSIVLDAIEPIVMTNKSDIFMISTPNGPQGFFYNVDINDSDYTKLKADIWDAAGYIYTKEEAEKELQRVDMDTDQEYHNKYTTGRDSIWGEVSDEMRTDEIEMEL